MKNPDFIFGLVKSGFWWFFIALCTVIFFIPVFFTALITYGFDSARKSIHPIVSLWARVILTVCPLMKVRLEGEQNLNPKCTYVIVSNHQSIADILAALHLNLSFKFIAKKELFWIPFLGWAMSLAGYIPLVRGNLQSGKNAILTAESLIKRNVSTLFFPEGTRSLDGEIHSFKVGAFKLAAETHVPVLPIVINGTYNLVPKGSRLFNRSVQVTVRVLEPHLPVGSVSPEQLSHDVRLKMVEALKEMRR